MSRRALLSLALGVLLAATATSALADGTADALQQGLYAEEILAEPRRAMALYRGIVAGKGPRRTRARAQLGIGRCLQRLGRDSEAVSALHEVLRQHPTQRTVVEQAWRMIRRYQDWIDELMAVRSEKTELARQVKALEAKVGSGKAEREELLRVKARLAALEKQVASQPSQPDELKAELLRQRADRQKVAADMARHFLDTAKEEERRGDYLQALRSLLLARQYTPQDPRIDSRISAVRTILGQGEPIPLDQLRREAGLARSRLEAELAKYRQTLTAISQLSEKEPLQALGRLRGFLLELPGSLRASPLGSQARSQLLEIMTWLAGTPGLQTDKQVAIPGRDAEQLRLYRLPQHSPVAPVAGGGIRKLFVDRKLRAVATVAFQPPTPEERRLELHRELSRLVSLDDPAAPSFAVAVSGQLVVMAPTAVHRSLGSVLSRIRRGLGQLYEVQIQLVRVPANTTAPWSKLTEDPAFAGDGAYQILDARGQRALTRHLAEGGGWSTHAFGPLRLWGRQRGEFSALNNRVFLVGYTSELVQGQLQARGVPRTIPEGLTLSVRALASGTGSRLEIEVVSTRIAYPVETRQTPHGQIQLPARSKQRVAVQVEVPREGGLLLFGLTDPISATRDKPGRVGLLLTPRIVSGAAVPDGQHVQRLPLGSLLSLPSERTPDLGGRKPLPSRQEILTAWIQGGDKALSLQLDGSALTASGPPASLSGFGRRLTELQREAATKVGFNVRGWSTTLETLTRLSKLAGKPLHKGGLVVTTGKIGRQLIDAMSRTRTAAKLPIPPGPYLGRGTARLVASKVSSTRFLRDPGDDTAPPRYATIDEGVVLTLMTLPGGVVDIRFQLGHLNQLVPVKRKGGVGYEPRRTLRSGQVSPELAAGQWAILTGISDPSDFNRHILLLIHRDKPE